MIAAEETNRCPFHPGQEVTLHDSDSILIISGDKPVYYQELGIWEVRVYTPWVNMVKTYPISCSDIRAVRRTSQSIRSKLKLVEPMGDSLFDLMASVGQEMADGRNG